MSLIRFIALGALCLAIGMGLVAGALVLIETIETINKVEPGVVELPENEAPRWDWWTKIGDAPKSNGLFIFEDRIAEVICWIYVGRHVGESGISCLPFSDTSLLLKKEGTKQ